jgi:alkylation response protein AidB-like acyl-CoA dehydrogenase
VERGVEVTTLTSVSVDAVRVAHEVCECIARGASDRDVALETPTEQIAELKRSGLTLLFVPEASGGLGGTSGDFVRIVEILAQGDPSVAQLFLVHCFYSRHLMEGTTGEHREHWCHRLVDDRVFVGNAASEVGTKTALDLRTELRRNVDGSGLLNGTKFYSTGSLTADVIGVLALEPSPTGGDPNVRTVFVDADAAGVVIHDDWRGMGQRTTGSGTIEFTDVVVPRGASLDAAVYEHETSPYGIQAQAGFAAIYSGIAAAAFHAAVTWVREKARPSPPSGVERAADDPFVVLRVGELSVARSSAAAVVAQMACALDRFEADPSPTTRTEAALAVSIAKAHAGEMALAVSQGLFHVAGASASLEKHNLGRFWRDARTLTIHDPVDYKYRLLGDYHLNDNPPQPGAFS